MTRADKQLVYDTIRQTCRRLGMPGLPCVIDFEMKQKPWNRVAEFSHCINAIRPCEWVIVLNSRYWVDFCKMEKKTVVAHEVTHIVEHVLHPAGKIMHPPLFWKLYAKTGYMEYDRKWHNGYPPWYAKLFPPKPRKKRK